ncbi:hypothetical protein QAD02_023425 [Eretmocerus hayati]|uniref:Uncharacterized protein n=1 Tax=Eretmocerus hayati TaxID=131215 RepID=A0ACC2PXG2_9HYME|nr:hypothetical protein QAD02_023425 [Eretmocerus hayati]
MLCLLCICSILGGIEAKDIFSNKKHTSPLVSEYEWKYLDYLWLSPEQKLTYKNQGLYKRQAMVPIDVDRSDDGRTFVTVPRSPGVPASLHTISDKFGESGPLLIPYPNWATYQNSRACRGITSVFRVTIDRCNRLWVLDTGKLGDEYICPAQLVVYDLFTDKLISKMEIPDNVSRNRSGEGLLITPIIETHGENCNHPAVYMADVDGRGLIVWNDGRFVRVESPSFSPDAKYSNFSIAGETFNLSDGIFGLALSPERYFKGNRFLFFRPLASRSIYAVSVSDLKSSKHRHPDQMRFFGSNDVLSSQATAMTFSNDGILFYGLTEEMAIGCWNLDRTLLSKNLGIPLVDKQKLQFVSGLKVVKSQHPHSKDNEQLLIFTNRFQRVMSGNQNFNEINFRILRAPIKDLVRGTVCEDVDRFSWKNAETNQVQYHANDEDSITSVLPLLSSKTLIK